MNRQRFANTYRPKIDHLENRVVPAPVTFQMRPQFSSITLDPTLHVGTTDIPLVEQGPGSKTTGQVGRQQADLDLGGLTLTFLDPGTNIFARTSGNWVPSYTDQPTCATNNGPAPADYGAQFEFPPFNQNYVALRDVANSLSSGPITLTVVDSDDWSFPVNAITFNQKAATLDSATAIGSGCDPFTGSDTNDSTALGNLHDNGNGSYNISIPIEGSFNVVIDAMNDIDVDVDYSGTLGGILPPGPAPIPGGPRLDSLSAQSLFEVTPAPVSQNDLADPLRPSVTKRASAETVASTVQVVSGINFTRPTGKVQVTPAFASIFADPLA